MTPLQGWRPVTASELGLLALAAALLGTGYYLVVTGMRQGEISLVAPFRYSGLLVAVLMGYAVWGEIPNAIAWGGILLLLVQASTWSIRVAERLRGACSNLAIDFSCRSGRRLNVLKAALPLEACQQPLFYIRVIGSARTCLAQLRARRLCGSPGSRWLAGAQVPERVDRRQVLGARARLALLPVVDRLRRCADEQAAFGSRETKASPLRGHAPGAEACAWRDGVFVGCSRLSRLPSPAALRSWRSSSCTRRFRAAISER